MSMLFSVIRIIPPMISLRRTAYLFAAIFGLMWVGLVVQKAYVCAHDKDWELATVPQCHLGKSVGIYELTCQETLLFITLT